MKNTIGTVAGVLAFVSIFFWEFSIFPILAIILGGFGTFNAYKDDLPKGMAIWGLVGGIIFLLVRLTANV